YDGVLITLGDQAGLTGSDYQKLLNAFDGSHIIASRYKDLNGVPALFPATYFPELAMMSGPRGAQQMLNNSSYNISAIAMPNAEFDIDTPVDLQLFANRFFEAS